MMQGTHAEWVARVGQGDTAAFEALYDAFSGHGMALAVSILHDRAEAEDALQDAFWSVWQGAGSYDPRRGSVSAWILMIVRSRAIDRLRQRQAKHMPTLHSDVTDNGHLPSIRGWAGDGWAGAVGPATSRVRDALDALPPEEYKAVTLALWRGFTMSQIAGLENIPVGTVKTRVRTGLRRLRLALRGVEGAAS